MTTVNVVDGSIPDSIAVALREAGHEVHTVRQPGDASGSGSEIPDVVVLSDTGLTSATVLAVRESLPGVRVVAARWHSMVAGEAGAPDLALPADADPAVWAMVLAGLDPVRELPDPALDEARTSLSTVVEVARRAFDALLAAGPPGAEADPHPNPLLDDVEARLRRSFELLLRVTLERLERRLEGFGGRSSRMAELARGLAAEAGASDEVIRAAESAGRFHDLGMHLVVSPSALRRHGPLREPEIRALHRHTGASVDALAPLRLSGDALEGIRDHHERLDGSGYPRRARGESVGLTARVVAVADCYEALSHPRPHRPAFSENEALDAMDRQAAAGRFDPAVCSALRSLITKRRGGGIR